MQTHNNRPIISPRKLSKSSTCKGSLQLYPSLRGNIFFVHLIRTRFAASKHSSSRVVVPIIHRYELTKRVKLFFWLSLSFVLDTFSNSVNMGTKQGEAWRGTIFSTLPSRSVRRRSIEDGQKRHCWHRYKARRCYQRCLGMKYKDGINIVVDISTKHGDVNSIVVEMSTSVQNWMMLSSCKDGDVVDIGSNKHIEMSKLILLTSTLVKNCTILSTLQAWRCQHCCCQHQLPSTYQYQYEACRFYHAYF